MTGEARPTLQDVARLAGVSASTVSRVVTGSRRVDPAIAQRVEDAAAKLRYRPDPLGRSLRRGSTQTIGFMVCDLTLPFFPELVQAMEGEVRRAGFTMLLADAQSDPGIEADCVAMMIGKRVDALLIAPCHRTLSAGTVAGAAAAVPVVQVDRLADPRCRHVKVDQLAGISQIVDHLLAGGRRTFAFIGSDPGLSTAAERHEAFAQAAGAADAGARGRMLVGDFSMEWGEKATAEIARAWPEVDAIVCANDLIAAGALLELQRRGVSVPGDVAVTGFDDSIIARVARPALTTVRQPTAEIARRAVAAAIGAIGGPGDGARGDRDGADPAGEPGIVLPPSLVIRDSTPAAP